MRRAAPEPLQNQGPPVPRIDGRLKVTGEALYAADFPLNNLAYGVLVTSDIARGEVLSIDFNAAKSEPGILDIISYGDIDGLKKPIHANFSATSLGPLHQKTIFHEGQSVALVVADTFEAASEAARNVR